MAQIKKLTHTMYRALLTTSLFSLARQQPEEQQAMQTLATHLTIAISVSYKEN